MNTNIINEIIKKHDKAEIILSCFFGIIDVIFYLIILCIFGCGFNKGCFSPRIKLSLIVILDFLFRIINLYITSFVFSLAMEIINTAFATIQFLLILLLLNQIFTDKNNERLLESAEIYSPLLTSLFFILFIIKTNISNFLLLVQYIAGIFAIIVYGVYMKGKIDIYLKNIVKKNPNFVGRMCLSNLPIFIPLYFIVYLALKIIILIFENQLYKSYMEMASDIFKEVGKYFTFTLVTFIYFLFNKYIKEEDYNYSSDSGIVGISSSGSSNYN